MTGAGGMVGFTATAVPGGVRLAVTGEPSQALRSVVTLLSEKIVNGDSRLRRRMFPETSDHPAEAREFRLRHEEGMRNEVCDAIERVLAHWPDEVPVVLGRDGVDDWFLVLTHARFLFAGRRAGELARRAEAGDEWARNVLWLIKAQRELLRAALPELR